MADIPAPHDFWCAEFGLCSFEDFAYNTDGLFDGLGLGPLQIPGTVSQLTAYELPFSASGLLAAAWIYERGPKHPPEPVQPAGSGAGITAVFNLIRYLNAVSRFDVPSFEEPKMPATIIPSVYRVSIEALSGAQEVVNVVGVRGTASGQHAAACAAVKAAWEAALGLGVRHTSQYSMQRYRAMDLSSADGGIAELASTLVGSSASPNATNAACALIKWNGSTRSRSSRGRMYWGPLNESDVNSDGRTLGASTITSLTTAVTAFRNSLSTANFPLVVISREKNTAYDVTSATVESVIATQRRRIRS